MKYETAYTLTLFSGFPKGIIPFRLELDGITFEIREQEEDYRFAIAYVSGPINTETINLRTGQPNLDGSEPDRGIDVPERIIFHDFFSRAVNTLSFVTDVPILYSHKLGYDRLIPETSEDEQRLKDLGTTAIFTSLRGDIYARSFSITSLSMQDLNILASKQLGLELYSKAILMQEPYAVYREYWKILESAFGVKDQELLNLLANYPPAQELNFSPEELGRLLVLRGRASHANSQKGMLEFHKVISETSRTLNRLKCLVEQVILTKKTWGSPSCGVDRLARLTAVIGEDGKLMIFK
jgi:hypothetical protein